VLTITILHFHYILYYIHDSINFYYLQLQSIIFRPMTGGEITPSFCLRDWGQL